MASDSLDMSRVQGLGGEMAREGQRASLVLPTEAKLAGQGGQRIKASPQLSEAISWSHTGKETHRMERPH